METTYRALTDTCRHHPARVLNSDLVRSAREIKPRRDKSAATSATLPRISPVVRGWFTWYCRRYLRRHFHALRMSRTGLLPHTAGRPLVIYSNHASWWDPLVCLVLKDAFFPGYRAFAPMDALMLERYKFFRRLGFFGVEQGSARGAAHFLRTAQAVLQSADTLLALTPQSRFADVRQRPIQFAAGIGHLAAHAPQALFLPVAIEYVFWEERLPEILVRLGHPVDPTQCDGNSYDARGWTQLFEQQLGHTQDALALEAQRRRTEDFQTLLQGGAGQGGIYDCWHAFRAKCRGETFHREHGNK